MPLGRKPLPDLMLTQNYNADVKGIKNVYC